MVKYKRSKSYSQLIYNYALYYTNIDFSWGEYAFIFTSEKTYSPSLRGEYVFSEVNINAYSPHEKSIFVLLYTNYFHLENGKSLG